MKSYYDAHESAYKEIKSKGFVGWGNVKTLAELGDSVTRAFLQASVEKWIGTTTDKKALDMGCGTGTTAFILSQMGFDVTGIDVSETAIELASDLAQKQNLKAQFKKWDVLKLEQLNEKFDLIYDSHCMHCIVFDEDRRRVLEGVKNSLSKDGIFILDTAIFSKDSDPTSGLDTLRFDENFILWHKTKTADVRGVVQIDGQNWCAQRRFYPESKVRQEVIEAGFKIASESTHASNGEAHGMLRLILTA